MKDNRKEELLLRRKQLQDRLEVKDFVASNLQPYLEVLDYFRMHNIPYHISAILFDKLECTIYLQEFLNTTPYIDYGFKTKELERNTTRELLDKWYDRFPSLSSFHYIPDLPLLVDYNNSDESSYNILLNSIRRITDSHQKVFMYHMQYAVVLEIKLEDLLLPDHKELFFGSHGDVIIFPNTVDWVIAFGLEDEWYGGKYKS